MKKEKSALFWRQDSNLHLADIPPSFPMRHSNSDRIRFLGVERLQIYNNH